MEDMNITRTPINPDEKYIKLNLGCGNMTMKGFINIDKVKLPGVDLVCSLEDARLPFKENSVEIIKCEHVLEHIDNFIPLLEEIYRICKPSARIYVVVPYYKYEGAFRDPTHKRFFTRRSFDYFSEACKYNYYSGVHLKVLRCRLTRNHKQKKFYKSDIFLKFIPFKRILDFFFWNIYTEIQFTLEVIKNNNFKKEVLS